MYKAQKALTYNKTVLYFILRIAKEMISAKNTQYAIRNTQYAIRNTVYSLFFGLIEFSNNNYISNVRTVSFSDGRKWQVRTFFV